MNEEIIITPQDILVGMSCIDFCDEQVIPRLVNADMSKAEIDLTERLVIIALNMMTHSPGFDHETGRMDIIYEDLDFLVTALKKYEDTHDPVIIGGLISLIKGGRLHDMVTVNHQ